MSSPPETSCRAAGAGWTGLPFTSAQLRFRSLDERDLESLIEFAGDEEFARWTAAIPHPFSEADGRAYIEASQQENRLLFAVEEIASGDFIGCIRIDAEAGVGDIGYWVARPHWGKGYAVEAAKRITRLAFEALELKALEAEVMQGNLASEKVLLAAGFEKSGEAVGTRGRYDGVATFRYQLAQRDWATNAASKPTLLVVAVAMVDADGRVLMAKRPAGKKLAGLWEFPGGKVSPGETPEAALIRELEEELGVDTRESCLAPFTFASHEYEDFRLLMPLYVCRVWQGTPQPKEGQELSWVRPVRMRDYPMPPADEPLVAMLCDLL
ncbi:MAG: bifunctional GNAT family N-acetyltransferase/(deoxy)nucleoside triphosphate pyrophosphohydrolase [Alphaproteobacteria bacterium]